MTDQARQSYDMSAALMEGYSAGQALRREFGREAAAVSARNLASLMLVHVDGCVAYSYRTVAGTFGLEIGDEDRNKYALDTIANVAREVFHLAGYLAGSRWEDTAAHADELAKMVSAAREWPTPPAKTEEEVGRRL